MKVTGLNGKGKGKLGAEVYSINHGVQIRREYNGEPSNPSTDSQVGQRSRFKLASQLSAVLSPVLAFTRKGLQSPRNIFTKKNMPYFYGDVDGAQVTYENLQLAPGSVPLGRLKVLRAEGSAAGFSIAGSPASYLDNIVLCAFQKNDTGGLEYMNSWVLDAKTAFNLGIYIPTNPSLILSIEKTYVFYAYGFRFNNDRAFAKYGQYNIGDAADFARLIANRTLSESDITFSQTRGVTLLQNAPGTVDPEEHQRVLYISTNTLGRVGVKLGNEAEQITEGGAFVAETGTNVTLTAKKLSDSSPNYNFRGWYNNGDQTPFSTASVVSFALNEQRDIIARWDPQSDLE